MSISKELQIIDLCIYLKKHNAIVISDVHIGYEEALNKQGILIPRLQFQQTMKRIENIINLTLKTNKKAIFDLIIINGDLKHEFGTISEAEWRQTLKFIDFLATKTKKIILIKGNHDTILEPIAKKRNLEIVDEYALGNGSSNKYSEYYFCHGNKIPKSKSFTSAKTIIIGHEHPAIALKEDLRIEKFKCFLFGKYNANNNRSTKRFSLKNLIKPNNTKNLIVLPSFNLVTEGTDVLKEDLLSPFLKQDLSDFEVYVVPDSESVLYFKRVKDINKLVK
ncbi:metallophosphoesterase [Candidatus Woesearchaeota archaeon]|nr:metallophosphoesterase [Candidatus Woesearchaeota archaeon]